MFKIEDNVPIINVFPRSKGYVAAVRKLQPGQSVALPITRAKAQSLLYYMSALSRDGLNRAEYVVGQEGEGVRIWRKQVT